MAAGYSTADSCGYSAECGEWSVRVAASARAGGAIMLMQQSKDVLTHLKTWNKSRLKALRRSFINRFRAFDSEDLAGALRRLSVTSGDTLLVHSSYDSFEGFRGKPSDIIQVLQHLVGEQGLLMFPTLPFTGSAIDYARADPLFDPARTPSRMGMLSELFRRSPSVVRSAHPTHPVALWGQDAAAVAADHHRAATPCGAGTPFEALHHRRGKIVLLGTGIGVLTFYHHIEEMIENELPFSPFTQQEFRLRTLAGDGGILEARCRLFDPVVSRRRNMSKLIGPLRAAGAWHETRAGGLSITLLHAADVVAAARALCAEGVYCYD